MHGKQADGAEIRPLVSVIIPAYNAASFIERTIRSAAMQTYSPLEIIVVNDGSTDDTAEICLRLSTEISNLRIITTANSGVANARNTGTQASRARYVAYLDADDLWHPTKIEQQVARLEACSSDPLCVACYAFSRIIDPQDMVTGTGPSRAVEGDFFLRHLIIGHVGNGSCLLVEREAALNVGGFDPSYVARGIGGCEDRDFELRILAHYHMCVVPQFLVGYRKSPGNMSSNYSRMARGYITVIETFSGISRVPENIRHFAICQAFAYSIPFFFRSRDWRNLFRTLTHQKTADLPAIIDLTFTITLLAVGRRIKNQLLRFVQTPVTIKRRPFRDYTPTEGLPPQNTNLIERRLARKCPELTLQSR